MTDMINDTNEQPEEEVLGQGLEEFWEQKLQASWSWVAPPCWHMDAFTNPEASQNPII